MKTTEQISERPKGTMGAETLLWYLRHSNNDDALELLKENLQAQREEYDIEEIERARELTKKGGANHENEFSTFQLTILVDILQAQREELIREIKGMKINICGDESDKELAYKLGRRDERKRLEDLLNP